MNKRVPESISSWRLKFDPYDIFSNEDWLAHADLTEDILQLQSFGDTDLILDVGYYQDQYRAFVVKNSDWDQPLDAFKSPSVSAMIDWVYSAISRYA
jgi:hypothetical protein